MRTQIRLLQRCFHSSIGILFAVFCCTVFCLRTNAGEQSGDSPNTGIVTANVLNVRARAGTHYEVVTQVECGDELQIVGGNDEWLEVLAPPGSRAWVAERYIGEEGKISGDRVRVHSGPGLVFTTFHYLNAGDRVTPTGEAVRGWQQIDPPEGATVWLSRAYVRVIVPEEEEAAAEGGAESSVEGSAESGVASEDEAPEVAEGEEAAFSEEDAEEAEPDVPEGADATSGEVQEDIISEEEVDVSEIPPEEKEAEEEEGPPESDEIVDRETEEAAGEGEETVGEGTAEEETAGAEEDDQVAEGSDVEDERAATRVRLEGIVLPLKDSGETDLTHVLGVRIGNTCFPKCFLRSDTIDLREWEWRRVGVYGKQSRPAGWRKPIIDVSSIQAGSSY